MSKRKTPSKAVSRVKKTNASDLSKSISKESGVRPLIGREQEFKRIETLLETSLNTGKGTCIYISGVPGTGKTATVRKVVKHLEQSASVSKFLYLEINGMKIGGDPLMAYVQLYKFISKKTLRPNICQKRLSEMFRSGICGKEPIVLVLDELDLLLKRKKSVLYHFFDWPSISNLVVIAIANTMDLPERYLTAKIASRLGSTRINFTPYTYPQLIQIIGERFSAFRLNLSPDMVEYCARKIGAISGDARRAISIIKRTCVVLKKQSSQKSSATSLAEGVQLIEEAINASSSSSPAIFIQKSCSFVQKLVLTSAYMKGTAGSLRAFSVEDLISHAVQISKSLDFGADPIILSVALNDLVSSRILKRKDFDSVEDFISSCVELTISPEDISCALASDAIFGRFFKQVS